MLDRRLHMVNAQLRTGGVVDKVVLAAFLDVPRQRFVAPEHESLAYLDRELPARGAKSRRLLAPMVLGRMLQAVTVAASDRALDIGGGSGYGAAVLAATGAKVVVLESDTGAAETARSHFHNNVNVVVVVGPLDSGGATLGPYDLIVVEGAFGFYPIRLINLLADPGRLVGIDASSEQSQAVVYEKNGGGISRRVLFETKAEILDGFKRDVIFAF
jgi:protein-L-isoaspartate(D-aspartate) O-methyltransferase